MPLASLSRRGAPAAALVALSIGLLQLTHPDFSIRYGLTTTNLSILPVKAVTAGT